MTRVFQAPDIELEKYSNFKDKYYKAVISCKKPFNKKVGYFNLFNEKTRPERELNDLFKKWLSKFSN